MLKAFRWSAAGTAVALVATLVFAGPAVALTVLILGVLEVSLSFDNAVVNAGVLRRMTPFWQKMFLTVGILIAVVGMRLLLPVLIVDVTTPLSFSGTIDQALHDPDAYGVALRGSEHEIYAFGGIFLLMIFCDFVFDADREITWIRGVERALGRVGGRVGSLSSIVALAAALVCSGLSGADERYQVLVAGVAGLLSFLAVSALDDFLEGGLDEEDDAEGAAEAAGSRTPGTGGPGTAVKAVGKAGLGAFIYLEFLDASFSFDGVIGAFAISNMILVIAVGLGIGALWIRSLTVYMVRNGTLDAYVYLEHGAHWAIGALALTMVLKIAVDVPEVVTGLLGAGVLVVAVICSRIERARGTYDGTDDDHLARRVPVAA